MRCRALCVHRASAAHVAASHAVHHLPCCLHRPLAFVFAEQEWSFATQAAHTVHVNLDEEMGEDPGSVDLGAAENVLAIDGLLRDVDGLRDAW